MASKRKISNDRLNRLAMPLDVADALKGAMQVPPTDEAKPKRRKKRAKKPKK